MDNRLEVQFFGRNQWKTISKIISTLPPVDTDHLPDTRHGQEQVRVHAEVRGGGATAAQLLDCGQD